MRGWWVQVWVQILLWWSTLGLLHALRRTLSFYYHRAADGMALPALTRHLGLPVLGGGYYCPQPHSAVFYLFWGALFLAPVVAAIWASRALDPEACHRRWSGAMVTVLLASALLLVGLAWVLSLPLVPIGSAVP